MLSYSTPHHSIEAHSRPPRRTMTRAPLAKSTRMRLVAFRRARQGAVAVRRVSVTIPGASRSGGQWWPNGQLGFTVRLPRRARRKRRSAGRLLRVVCAGEAHGRFGATTPFRATLTPRPRVGFGTIGLAFGCRHWLFHRVSGAFYHRPLCVALSGTPPIFLERRVWDLLARMRP